MRLIDWSAQRLLVVTPHADDETLMAGGLLQLVPTSQVVLMALADTVHGAGSSSLKTAQWGNACRLLSPTIVSRGPLSSCNGQLYEKEGLRRAIGWLEDIIHQYQPTVVVTALPSHHQDHRFTYEACMAALRVSSTATATCAILLGEHFHTITHPYSNEHGPSLYVELSNVQVENKMRALRKQALQISSNPWVANEENLRLIARMRGLECGTEYAERFEIRRLWA